MNVNAFRALLLAMSVVLLTYTARVGRVHGWDLLPVFFGDIARFTWPGQFNLDFLCLLILSGLWVAWRHRYSAAGIALGLLASVGGTAVLAPYLLITSLEAKGDLRAVLLGADRAR